MSGPRTGTFLANLRASGLLDQARLDEVGQWTAAATGDDRALARELVGRGLLTPFQADRILAGRPHGFFIGQYVILGRIGAGGMGRVYKAMHRQMERPVALKVLNRSRRTDPGARARFLREARASAQLNHPNIVRAYDVGEEADVTYLVMEYIEGTDVLGLIKAHGKLEPRRAAAIARQVARALEHAREQGIVHRDIKPSNILLDENDTPKVLDMGLARIEHTDAEVDASTTLTRDGALMGTVDYLAPEQAMDSHSADTRADIYSLGCTLYHMLAGRVPFPASTVAEKLMKHQLREPEPVFELARDVPIDLDTIVARMMAKQVADRYQTPAEVADALDAFLSGASVSVSRPAPTPSPASGPIDTMPSPSELLAGLAEGPPVAPPAPPRHPVRIPSGRPLPARPRGAVSAVREWLRSPTRMLAVGLGGLALVLLTVVVLLLQAPRPARRPEKASVAEPAKLPDGEAHTVREKAAPPAPAHRAPRPVGPVITNTIGMKLVYIKPGSFPMGSPPGEEGRDDDETAHRVTITMGFYMAAHEVTNAQYRQYKPDHSSGEYEGHSLNGDSQPVVLVSWEDAVGFCKWLSQKEGRTYRLPTEAEWEYACRAGTQTAFSWGDPFDPSRCNFSDKNDPSGPSDEAADDGYAVSAPVGSYRPNAWGLYDMHGNVWEWCQDWHTGYGGDTQDPQGAQSGSVRVLRGGSWLNDARHCRSAYRNGFTPGGRNNGSGFRVLCVGPVRVR